MKCELCQTQKDDLNDVMGINADCGAMGELRADLQISCFDGSKHPEMMLYLWQRDRNNTQNEIGRARMHINYCPACGRRMNEFVEV